MYLDYFFRVFSWTKGDKIQNQYGVLFSFQNITTTWIYGQWSHNSLVVYKVISHFTCFNNSSSLFVWGFFFYSVPLCSPHLCWEHFVQLALFEDWYISKANSEFSMISFSILFLCDLDRNPLNQKKNVLLYFVMFFNEGV